jgi:uncharacterized protein YkwD
MHRRPRSAAPAACLACLACLACGGAPQREPSPAAPTTRGAASAPAEDGGEPYPFQAFTRSPQTSELPPSDVARACPERDAALERAAAFAARRELEGKPALDAEDVTLVLRAEGAPYVWPRIWTLSGQLAGAHASERFAAWLAELDDGGARRCGVARADGPNGREVVVGIALGVLADLEPLPTQVSIGTWLDVKARLLYPAAHVDVIVLGPRGQAHSVPSSLEGGRIRARFHADREGSFLVQILASVDGGPRPVAEALVLAGDAPRTLFTATRAPGEEASTGTRPDDAVFRMLNGARESEGVRPLTRDARLERLARAHAEAMRVAGRLAHDVGDGGPTERVAAASVAARAVGENVAHAADARHAHRTLWRSPSHRSNQLDPRYDAAGIGVAEDADGTLWVCELFATLGAP